MGVNAAVTSNPQSAPRIYIKYTLKVKSHQLVKRHVTGPKHKEFDKMSRIEYTYWFDSG